MILTCDGYLSACYLQGAMLAAIGTIDMSFLSKSFYIVGKMKHKQLKSEIQEVKKIIQYKWHPKVKTDWLLS